jgi:hypothetical protein
LCGFGRLPDVHATPIPVRHTQAGMGGFSRWSSIRRTIQLCSSGGRDLQLLPATRSERTPSQGAPIHPPGMGSIQTTTPDRVVPGCHLGRRITARVVGAPRPYRRGSRRSHRPWMGGAETQLGSPQLRAGPLIRTPRVLPRVVVLLTRGAASPGPVGLIT